ncbi:MAG: DUF4199 domain-containing protein [candidate division KSB1 bacterium]
MRKVVLTYGLQAGAIVSVVMLLGMALWVDAMFSSEYGELIGYTSMIVALSLVFFGVKSYRDNYLSGVITFGKGLHVGILITLIAAVMYAGAWEIALHTQPKLDNFMENYSAKYLDKMRERGASETEIQKQAETMAVWTERYKNPLLRFGMTLMEILPVGIIITLISAAILRRKEVLPVAAQSAPTAA